MTLTLEFHWNFSNLSLNIQGRLPKDLKSYQGALIPDEKYELKNLAVTSI